MKHSVIITGKPVESFDKETIPKEYMTYHFYDDGKSSPSRHRYATVKDVVPYAQFKKGCPHKYRLWKKQLKQCYWLYHKKTDYFVRCEVIFVGTLWFARTINGEWFSFDGGLWDNGELDVGDFRTKRNNEFWNGNYEDKVKELAFD